MSEDTALEVGRLYGQIKRIADVLTASQKDIFVRLPALVGYWPMGLRAGGFVNEHSGSALDLTQTGTCQTGYDGNSFTHLGDGTNYLWNSSTKLAMSGTESWVEPGLRGMTVGGWFWVDETPTTRSGLVSRDGASTDRGWTLGWFTGDEPFFLTSGNGAAVQIVTAVASSLDGWHFLVGRFIPSVEIDVFVDGVKTTFTTAIPSSLYGSSQDFELGRHNNDNSRIIHGRARDVFICAANLSDALLEEVRVTSVP